MDNKRCEITVALYGDTSNSSSVPDAFALASPQYFVEAYAMRDAYSEKSGWHYPVILRFEETDAIVDLLNSESAIRVEETGVDAYSMINAALTTESADLSCPYLARVESLDCCSGEPLTHIQCSTDDCSILLRMENHVIRIS